MKPLYLDSAATTKVKPAVVRAINEFLTKTYGNASSLHKMGEDASKAIEVVRKQCAKELGCKSSEIIFTSGATESDNIALRCLDSKKKKIIISAIEHPAIEETARALEKQGFEIVRIPVDAEGFIDLRFLEKAIDKKTALVSVIHGNNIFGTLQELGKIGKICKKKNVLFHTDATQSFGKENINVRNLGIHLLSASAHKIGGPKGVGLLYVKDSVKLRPWLYGGGQEKGIRSGTENAAGIVGFGKALVLEKKINQKNISRLRDELLNALEAIGGKVIGSKTQRLSNNITVCFPVNNETLVYRLSHKGIYVSAGSACDSKKEQEDYVLKAIGLTKKERDGSIRISLSEDFKKADIARVVNTIKKQL